VAIFAVFLLSVFAVFYFTVYKGKAGTLSSPDEKQKWPYNEDELARLCGLR
jgi:hypothetical protein